MKISRSFLDSVAAKNGPSFYLLDSVRFQSNFSRLTAAFRKFYEETTIAYSYKTNYVPRYCELVSQLGGFAEVVSSMEMTLAIKLGVPPQKIFFNGPYKEEKCIETLLQGGGTVNIDSWHELERVARVAHDYNGDRLKVGLRCNFDVNDGVLSRFGFDVDSREFEDAISLIDNNPNLRLAGLHCHYATRSLDCWINRSKAMISVIDRFFRNRLHQLSHVSLGGGMYGHMPDELKKQFPVYIPDFEEYASAAALPFAQYFDKNICSARPTLIIEPGTALVADAMKFVCQIDSIKQVRGRTFVSLTGSTYNINPNPNRKNVPISCISSNSELPRAEVKDAYMCGYTCIENDYLFKKYCGSLAVGDFIVFDDVGSYSIVMKPPFILPNVAIIEPLGDGCSWRTIKRAETFEDIFSSYFCNDKFGGT